MSEQFKVRHVPGLFYRADNQRCVAGHVRLLGFWRAYLYGEQAPGWAVHRRWNFGLFCIHHVGPGKAVDEAGWHVTWAGLRRSRCCNALHWRWADTFRTKGL